MSNKNNHESPAAIFWQRREFVTTVLKAISAAPLLGVPVPGFAMRSSHSADFTVQQVIDLILKSVPGSPFPNTVDTIKSGDPSQKVTGIVTTMFATDAVIEKAIKAGANFIIAHEPTFYNHLDETDWLENSEVYQHKKQLLEKNKIVVWRFHDGLHAHKPDGVMMGVLEAMNWQKYYDAEKRYLISIPSLSLDKIISNLKKNLGIKHLKFIGNVSQQCSRIAILPGAGGGKSQIGAIMKGKPDLVICGEINEWETAEYVRDARFMGEKISLVILGHAVSEEPGLQWLSEWLRPRIEGVKITHIPSGDPFEWG